jgi:hypothetical protein
VTSFRSPPPLAQVSDRPTVTVLDLLRQVGGTLCRTNHTLARVLSRESCGSSPADPLRFPALVNVYPMVLLTLPNELCLLTSLARDSTSNIDTLPHCPPTSHIEHYPCRWEVLHFVFLQESIRWSDSSRGLSDSPSGRHNEHDFFRASVAARAFQNAARANGLLLCGSSPQLKSG